MNTRSSTLNDLAFFGLSYIRWASRLFITGLSLQLIPLVHYPVGGAGRPVGEKFLEKVILWFGCPAEMATQILLVGGLSLFAVGGCYLYLSGRFDRAVTSSEQTGLKLSVAGLIATVFSGPILYLIFDFLVYTNFYFEPHEPQRTIWLVAQLVTFLVYFAGILVALGSVKRDVNGLLSTA